MSYQDDDYVAKVHVVADTSTKPEPKKTCNRNSTTRTLTNLTAAGDTLLGDAPNRCEATIAVLGVLATNSNIVVGQSLSEAVAGTGAQYQPGQVFRVHNTDALYVAPIGAGTPPLVSVLQVFDR